MLTSPCHGYGKLAWNKNLQENSLSGLGWGNLHMNWSQGMFTKNSWNVNTGWCKADTEACKGNSTERVWLPCGCLPQESQTVMKDLQPMETWWGHQMETFSTLLGFCVVHSPVTGEFTAQRPVMQSFEVFFDLRLNKSLSKQSWGWWFEMPSCSLWHHCNGNLSRRGIQWKSFERRTSKFWWAERIKSYSYIKWLHTSLHN